MLGIHREGRWGMHGRLEWPFQNGQHGSGYFMMAPYAGPPVPYRNDQVIL